MNLSNLKKRRLNFVIGFFTLLSPVIIHIFYVGGIGSFIFSAITIDSTSFAEKYSCSSWGALSLGSQKPKIVQVIGRPINIWEREGREVWDYSKSTSDSHYHIRQLEFNTKGLLVQKIGYYYID